jgi:hypothetical protein
MSLIAKDQNGNTISDLAPSAVAVGVGASPEGATGIVPYSADTLLDVHNPDWVKGDDTQLRVGDLILDSRHSGSSDVEADNQRGANGNLGLGAKGFIFFYTQDTPSEFSIKVWLRNNGHVGIGPNIKNPQERLEVEGNIVATGDVRLSGGDCAEEFDVEEYQTLDPGTVMVIGDEERLCQCVEAYDTKVAGVLSGAGDCKPGILLGKGAHQNKRMPLALNGKVYCKVDAQYGAITTGDLLTTSPTPGHAMKVSDPLFLVLRPLTQGRGLIPILVALQ